MTREQAQAIQYRHHTWYVVFLVGPAGEKVRIGRTQRKNGQGLMAILRQKSDEELAKLLPDAATLTFKKTRTALEISNGWKVVFGGTLLEEASDTPPAPTTTTAPTQTTLF